MMKGKPSWDRLDQDFGEAPDWRSSLVVVGTPIWLADGQRWYVRAVMYAKDANTKELIARVEIQNAETKKRETLDLFHLERELETTMQAPTAWERLQEDVDPDPV